jgi:hypothetical protein
MSATGADRCKIIFGNLNRFVHLGFSVLKGACYICHFSAPLTASYI